MLKPFSKTYCSEYLQIIKNKISNNSNILSALGKVKIFQAKGVRWIFKQRCALPWLIN
jgi:hypothetical protein